MGKRLYCFITGKGDNVNWEINGLPKINEQQAWETAFQKRGIVVNQNENKNNSQSQDKEEGNPWQQIYNNWNNCKWGQINSRVGLNDCIIWIKKKKKFNIDKKVESTHAPNIVNEIKTKLNHEKINDIDEIIILVHAFEGIAQNVTTNYTRINQIPVKWITYTTAHGVTKDEPIWMVKLVIEAIYSCNKLSNLCNELYKALPEAEKKIEATERIKNFSLLKHRIAYLFLPLDIDLQGISEVEGKKVKENDKELEKDAQIDYLEKVLGEKKTGPKDSQGKPCHYRQKLADLWYIVAKKIFKGEKINECEMVDQRNRKELLTDDGKGVIDLIIDEIKMLEEKRNAGNKKEEIERKEEEIEKYWELLLEICGLKFVNGSLLDTVINRSSNKNIEEIINEIKINPDKNSPILKFMCLMDSKIIMKDQIQPNDVEEILNYFKEGWKVKGANPEIIKSFHDWFCALDDCLDKIRKGLKDE
jgi:hypothetical protein